MRWLSRMKTVITVSILCLFFLCSCSKADNDDGLAKISIDFVWDLRHLTRSPEIHLENVPEGVDRLTIYFYDVSANDYSHGGGSMHHDGSGIIQPGAFKDFKGLTTMFGIPKIKLTVEAFNKNGRLAGKGAITKKPPDQ